ncbi:MAG: CDP-glucose 4,6-dehydratase [Bacteroidota bacterium]|nr:CDP-glucose 4,6-dehydratase [Bacteroidota bacterium]
MENLFDGIFAGKRVFITGHTGFKGSWLALWLNQMGATVKGYALPPNTQPSNWESMHLDIESVVGDVRDKNHLAAEMTSFKPDIAFHLAAQPIVLESYNNPQTTFETNLMGTVNFFEAVRNTPEVKVAINITSDKCYQNNEWVWGYRENEPMGGDDPYSASKGCSELITHSYLKSFFSADGSCHIASARAGNVIGGGDWANYRILPDFFRAIQKNEKLEIRNPLATRPWQHVLEPLSGYLLLAKKLWCEGKTFSGGWNFGPIANEQHSVRELVDLLIQCVGQGDYYTPDKDGLLHEATLLGLDVSKAALHLQWKPVLNFEETAEFTARGYLDEINGNGTLTDKRIEQLKEYSKLAKERKIVWS